jgi:hypothetical protein
MRDTFGLEEELNPPALAAERALEKYYLASFSFHHPELGIGDNDANCHLLREKLQEKGLRFTEGNIAQLLHDEPAFLDSLARTPELRANVVRVEADLRKELIQKLAQAKASQEFFKRDQTPNLRWVDTQPIQKLEDLLDRISKRVVYEHMDKKTLRQTARQEHAAKHPQAQFEPLPATVARFALRELGFVLPKDEELPEGVPFGERTIKKLIKCGGYNRLMQVYGLDAINTRLREEKS